MKKIIAMISLVALASCGGSASTEEVKSDSVVVDSVVVSDSVVVDTTVASPVGGGGSAEVSQPIK